MSAVLISQIFCCQKKNAHLMDGLLGFLELDPHLWRLCGPCASGRLSGACRALQQGAPLSTRLELLRGEELPELERLQGPLQVEVPGG
jgi:hypothetical protein